MARAKVRWTEETRYEATVDVPVDAAWLKSDANGCSSDVLDAILHGAHGHAEVVDVLDLHSVEVVEVQEQVLDIPPAPLVGRAMQAGLDVDNVEAQAILQEMKRYNRKFERIASDTESVLPALENAQAECRATS